MITNSPLFALGVKVIGLTAIAAILFSANVALATTTVEEEEPEVESDGGLTARLNGVTFGRGDTVTVTGTVEERDGSASMYATIIDPAGIEISTNSIAVGSDLTFRYGFVAGEVDEMTTAGIYTVQIQYFPPGDAGIQSVTLDFEYNPEAPPAPQTEQEIGTEEEAITEPTTTFQNLTEGFRIQVPNGWVADDDDAADSVTEAFIARNGYDFLGAICPQEQALPKIGGLYDCTSTDGDGVSIIEYPNLRTRPEFARVINQNLNITLNDIVAFDFEQRRKAVPEVQMSLEGQADTSVNVVDPTTNQTVQTLPAKEVVYGIHFGDEIYGYYSLIVLADNGNSAYVVRERSEGVNEIDEGMPTFARQAFDSLEVLASNSSQVQQQVTEAQQQS